MTTQTNTVLFPPPIGVGQRVVQTYADLGGCIAYEIRDTTFYTGFGSYRYHVKWDDGTESAHYPNDLIGIGEFRTLDALKEALELIAVHLDAGPQGGFRVATVDLNLNGVRMKVEIRDPKWWRILRPIIDATSACIFTTTRAPRQYSKM